MEKHWCNKLWLGLVVGLLLPIISSFVIVKTRFHGDYSYGQLLVVLFRMYSFGKLLSISVLPNLLFFFIILKTNWMFTARGIVIATAIYATGMMILFLVQ